MGSDRTGSEHAPGSVRLGSHVPVDRSEPPADGRILVFRPLPGIGPLLSAIPALRSIRRHRPDLTVTLVTVPSGAAMARRFSRYVDEVVEFPGWTGRIDHEPERDLLSAFLDAMRTRRFDLAIQLHGSGLVANDIVSHIEARRSAGFYPAGTVPPARAGWITWTEGIPDVAQCLRLARHLGWPDADDSLEAPETAHDRSQTPSGTVIGELLATHTVFPYACVHAGSGEPEWSWPGGRMARVADALALLGFTIVLTGSSRDIARSSGIKGAMRRHSFDLAGRTNLDDLMALFRRAAVVICGDTNSSLLADALAVPSVALLSSSDAGRWASLDRERHRVVAAERTHPDQVLEHVASLTGVHGVLGAQRPQHSPAHVGRV
jgi:ADP-heptose:LPS heptosyltransferase